MKGDFTRDTFDPTKHYQQVLMQQGRAQLDADWNEQAALGERRDETTTADIVGKCGGPAERAAFGVTTDGSLTAGDFFLSAGHYYVDGILCENESAIAYTATWKYSPRTTVIYYILTFGSGYSLPWKTARFASRRWVGRTQPHA